MKPVCKNNMAIGFAVLLIEIQESLRLPDDAMFFTNETNKWQMVF
jgi:hypothetical protein